MADEMQALNNAINDWVSRVEKKTTSIENKVDEAIVKAAFFCEGKAKQNVMDVVYRNPIPTGVNGKELWKRTGALKASIGSGLDPDRAHSAIIFASVPYAKFIEFGTGMAGSSANIYRPWGDGGYTESWAGMAPRPFMYPAIFQHKQEIKDIIKNHLKSVIN